MTEMERYIDACNYPGKIDPAAVKSSLESYLKSLGVVREVRQLKPRWYQDLHLFAYLIGIARDARDALDARDARDALDALDAPMSEEHALALLRFGSWCIMNRWWGAYDWDLSWIVTTHLGAKQNKKKLPWAEPLFEAFCNGCWFLFWTNDGLYWVPKPTIHKSADNRLHRDDGPAVPNPIEDLYFIEGILADEQIVMRPRTQTIAQIDNESNADLRAIRMNRFGVADYLRDSGCKLLDGRTHPRDELPEKLYVDKQGRHRLVVIDPSTDEHVSMLVPRECVTCEQAQAIITHGADRQAMCRT